SRPRRWRSSAARTSCSRSPTSAGWPAAPPGRSPPCGVAATSTRCGAGSGRRRHRLPAPVSATARAMAMARARAAAWTATRRFGRVAVLHSHLSDAERHRHWQSIAAGEVQVVVGARSAVFAPARRLGLIVIDEEHETTFKQETTPRYHARDVAVKRAQLEEIP